MARSIDLNGDGNADFSFWSTGPIGTADFPTSFLLWPYYVGVADTNQVLVAGFDALFQALTTEVSSNAQPGSAWDTPSFAAGLAAVWSSSTGRIIDGQLVYGGWYGSLVELGVGYLPVHFFAADGSHYGWVRVRLPDPGGFLFNAPIVVDWAYETHPNAPLRAGDIDSSKQSILFTVEFLSPRPNPRRPVQTVGTGSFILTGEVLRSELSMAGRFFSAQILDPNHPHAKGKVVIDFGQPLVCTASHTGFFRDATLTRSEIVQLLHGAYYVSIDNGAALARILPVATSQHSRTDSN
jgi:hypothetical protein